MILGKVSVNTSFSTEELKNQWRLADTILQNNGEYYICMKIIDVETYAIQCLTYIVILKYISIMNKKQIQPTYKEKGVRYMMCQCGNYISVGDTAINVTCSRCVNIAMMNKFPELHEEKKQREATGRPAGWHFMAEFVDKDGNVFHKGKEQPKLFGTLKPTKVKPPKKKPKRRTKEEILIARHNKKKEALKKAKQTKGKEQ